ncbi:Uncharacterised protein [Shigella dysenteriae]|nr:Uncharacterised protein [Shigella dysenteriae]
MDWQKCSGIKRSYLDRLLHAEYQRRELPVKRET